MIGFPFMNRPDLAFQIGAVSFFNVTINITTRPLNQMLVNFTNVLYLGGALLPYNLENTNQKVTSNDVFLGLATNNVWVSSEERLSIVSAYRETIFKEFLNLGSFTANTPTAGINILRLTCSSNNVTNNLCSLPQRMCPLHLLCCMSLINMQTNESQVQNQTDINNNKVFIGF